MGSSRSLQTVRNGLNSRIKTDDTGKYPPSLKVNICLTKGPKHVLVHSTTREASGRINRPRCDSEERWCHARPFFLVRLPPRYPRFTRVSGGAITLP